MTLFSSVHICIAFRLLRRGNMKLHALLGHPVSWKLFEVVSNIKKQLCIVFMYTGNLSIISTISQFESDSKMCTFEVHLCMMSGQLILSGKPFNTFSMARLTILQLRLILTPLFTATHAFILSSYHFFHMICDWGIFFILVTLDLCLLLIHRDLWNSQKWQILISVNRDLDFFNFLR